MEGMRGWARVENRALSMIRILILRSLRPEKKGGGRVRTRFPRVTPAMRRRGGDGGDEGVGESGESGTVNDSDSDSKVAAAGEEGRWESENTVPSSDTGNAPKRRRWRG